VGAATKACRKKKEALHARMCRKTRSISDAYIKWPCILQFSMTWESVLESNIPE
jgi:hypothetical protein